MAQKWHKKRQNCLSEESAEQRLGAPALIDGEQLLPTSDSTADRYLHHPKKPFEFYHLAYRKKLTSVELAP